MFRLSYSYLAGTRIIHNNSVTMHAAIVITPMDSNHSVPFSCTFYLRGMASTDTWHIDDPGVLRSCTHHTISIVYYAHLIAIHTCSVRLHVLVNWQSQGQGCLKKASGYWCALQFQNSNLS